MRNRCFTLSDRVRIRSKPWSDHKIDQNWAEDYYRFDKEIANSRRSQTLLTKDITFILRILFGFIKWKLLVSRIKYLSNLTELKFVINQIHRIKIHKSTNNEFQYQLLYLFIASFPVCCKYLLNHSSPSKYGWCKASLILILYVGLITIIFLNKSFPNFSKKGIPISRFSNFGKDGLTYCQSFMNLLSENLGVPSKLKIWKIC